MSEQLVRAFDVAERLGYSLATVKVMARRGELPGAVRIGRRVRFDMDEVERFIKGGGSAPIAPKKRSGRQKIRVTSGNRPPMISEASETVQTSRIPGVGMDYEHKGMKGRNVTGAHPWRPVTVQ